MVPAMIQLARGLSLRIVAEGWRTTPSAAGCKPPASRCSRAICSGCALPQEAFSARYLPGSGG